MAGFPHLPTQETQETQFSPWVKKIPWRRKWQLTPVFLPGESHGLGAWQATVHSVAKKRVGHDWRDLACIYAQCGPLALVLLLLNASLTVKIIFAYLL